MKVDKEWFCEQIHKNEKGMYLVAYKLLGNEEDVKDAMQETILSAYTDICKLSDSKKFNAWIIKILINKCYDIIRKRKYQEDIDDFEEKLAKEESDATDKMLIDEAMKNLDEPYKTVVILYYYQEFSIKEISEIMNVKASAIKKQLQRAREKLKKIIDEGGKNE